MTAVSSWVDGLLDLSNNSIQYGNSMCPSAIIFASQGLRSALLIFTVKMSRADRNPWLAKMVSDSIIKTYFSFPQSFSSVKIQINLFCNVFTHFFEVAILQKWSYLLCPRDEESGGILIYPLSVRPFVRSDIDTWFVRLSPPTVLELQL